MVLWSLVACLFPWSMGGEETDGRFETGGMPASDAAAEIEVASWFASGSPDEVGQPHTLVLEDNGARGISVEHFGFEAPCTAAVDGSAALTDDVITVAYSAVAPGTYSDTCAWTLRYTLRYVEPGTWTVIAESDAGTVTVGER